MTDEPRRESLQQRYPRVNLAILVLGLVLIPIWQASFARHPERLDDDYRQRTTGLMGHDVWRDFFYFHYYLGLFPVLSEETTFEYSRAGAEALLRDHPDSILMEKRHKMRDGELGQVFAFWPAALLRGSPEGATVRTFNILVFVASLMALWFALWWAGHPIAGLMLVVLAGSNPHQLYEIYVDQHVLGFAIAFALLVLALHLPLMGARKAPRWYPWLLPAFAGVLFAAARQVRPEPFLLVISVLAIYLTAPGLRWTQRGAMALSFLVATWVATLATASYFEREFQDAAARVGETGGHVYNGPRRDYHTTWFAIFAGLGDFDKKKGYGYWEDRDVYRYGLPLLEKRLGIDLDWQGELYLNHYYDGAGKYGKKLEDYPEFNEIIRDKVIGDIAGDPLWYAGILWDRLKVIGLDTTPLRLAWGGHWTTIAMWPAVAIPLALLFTLRREWFLLKLLLFTLPLSLTALLIFSGRGASYYSSYHLFVIPLFASYLVGCLPARRDKAGKSAPQGT